MEIQGFPNYIIYNDGRIYSKKSDIFMKQSNDNYGYKTCKLCNDGKSKMWKVHRLVAIHYIINLENKPQVDHIDGCKVNNNVNNLRWATCLENSNYFQKIASNNKSGVKNVCYDKKYDRFYYSKNTYGKTHQKTFNSFEEAVEYKNIFERDFK